MTAANLLRQVVHALDEAGIPHMLVGSFAGMSHGASRTTQDIDIVIDPTGEALSSFVAAFDPETIYVEPSAMKAPASRDQFNVIDTSTGWKVDLIIRKDRPFSATEFERRLPTRLFGVLVYVATAEDTVLAKLEWAAMGGSDRQVADAAAVLGANTGRLDEEYLDRWAAELGVTELLARARRG
jgi:hypothetical protein